MRRIFFGLVAAHPEAGERGGTLLQGVRVFVLRLVALLLALCSSPALAQITPETIAAAKAEGRVVIYGATDYQVAQPLIRGFEASYPGVKVDYHDMNSAELYQRFRDESDVGPSADVTWSSAMDLQVKLVNDGYAQTHRSAETNALPAWAIWRNEAFGTTFEPIAFVYNKRLLKESEVPRTHAELARLFEQRAAQPRGWLTVYDPNRSGLGFLLHSQDAQANPAVFWGLAQAMGRAGVRGEVSTAAMLQSISAGDSVIGYNVLGSYAYALAAKDPALGVVLPRDYTLVLSRVAFIARKARHPSAARLWLDYLLSVRGQQILTRELGFFSVREDGAADSTALALKQQLGGAFRPIVIGSGLLAYLDQIKRRDFLKQWNTAVAPN